MCHLSAGTTSTAGMTVHEHGIKATGTPADQVMLLLDAAPARRGTYAVTFLSCSHFAPDGGWLADHFGMVGVQ